MRTVELHENQYDLFQGECTVDTGGLTECVGIIVYDPIRKSGYVGHFIDVNERMRSMLSKAKNELGELVLIYIAGGAIDDPSEMNHALENRKNSIQLIRTYFPHKTIMIRWGPDKTVLALIINISTGETVLEINYDDGSKKEYLFETSPNPLS